MAELKILLYCDSYNGRVGINDAYVNFASQFGEVILVSPLNNMDFFIEHGDVLMLPGGADIDPKRYGETPHYMTGRTNTHYEYLDTILLSRWLLTEKPIIGICRGMQALNVELGGSLFQHIIHHVQGEDREETEDVVYTDIEGFNIIPVNSYHHQALKRIATGLEVIGWGEIYKNCPSLRERNRLQLKHIYEKRKGSTPQKVRDVRHPGQFEEYFCIAEIVKHVELPYLGFQYHPEEFNCPLAVKLISEMLDDYRERLQRPVERELAPFAGILPQANVQVIA